MTFVVSTFKRPGALRTTLTALVDQDYPRDLYEVVVVDDGPDDATAAVIGEFTPSVPRIKYVTQQQAGVARARNLGAARADGELLIFLDDDIIVERDHVTRHLAVRELHGDCLVNGHWEFAPETRRALESTPFGRFRIGIEDWVKEGIAKQPLDDGRLEPTGVTACNLSVSASRFWEIGGFDESFPFAGCEDQDFSHRAKRAGARFVYDPAIRLLHNDDRVTLEGFCARQWRGALTSVYLVARHPDAFANRPLLLENAQITSNDPLKLRVKKLLKRFYSTRSVLWFAKRTSRTLERVAPDSALLRRVYAMTIGAYIYKGVQEGLRRLPKARAAAEAASGVRYGGADATRQAQVTRSLADND